MAAARTPIFGIIEPGQVVVAAPDGSFQGLSLVTNEQPVGTLDGLNATFTASQAWVAGSLCVYLNGLRQRAGATSDYIEANGTQITFNDAPHPGDTITLDYRAA